MIIVLIGYMGSGKSSIGKSLAAKLHTEFVDLDDYIAIHEGLSVSEIFELKGEIYFRKKEQYYLQKILSEDKDYVLSLGGGTPCFGDTMQIIKAHPKVLSFYLEASRETLVLRLFAEKDERPLIAHLSTKELLDDFIRKHLFERAFYYNKADHIIKTDSKRIETITMELIALVHAQDQN